MADFPDPLQPAVPRGHDLRVHGEDPHNPGLAARLNWLRAGVLGANDGIVSTAALLVGVAAANPYNTPAIATAALAGGLAGAASMALGEYVSVSTQRDTEKALIRKESRELEQMPEAEFAELISLYREQGLSQATAETVARELTAKDPLKAHLHIELGIDGDELANPWQAAGASALSFAFGALMPTVAILVTPPGQWRIPATFVAVLVALLITGWLSATVGRSPRPRAIFRVVTGGALAMSLTWLVGHLFGIATG